MCNTKKQENTTHNLTQKAQAPNLGVFLQNEEDCSLKKAGFLGFDEKYFCLLPKFLSKGFGRRRKSFSKKVSRLQLHAWTLVSDLLDQQGGKDMGLLTAPTPTREDGLAWRDAARQAIEDAVLGHTLKRLQQLKAAGSSRTSWLSKRHAALPCGCNRSYPQEATSHTGTGAKSRKLGVYKDSQGFLRCAGCLKSVFPRDRARVTAELTLPDNWREQPATVIDVERPSQAAAKLVSEPKPAWQRRLAHPGCD